jgi:glycosyltransferase involved in cell wall biosynthesis/predicted kinase
VHGPHPPGSECGFAEAPEARPEPIANGSANQSRHILHVITRLLQGGAEENTISTCLYQVRQGNRVSLVHGRDAHPSWAKRLEGQVTMIMSPSLGQPLNPVRDAKAIWELRNLFMALRPDVVHTHQSKAGIIGRLAAALARTPLIAHTVHIAPFVNVSGPRRWFYVTAERICERYTHLFISVSQGMRQAFHGEGIGRKKTFEVIHSGMDLAKFISATPPGDWRARIGGWDSSDRPKFILMLAAFEPRKRQYGFIEAIAPHLHARSELCLLFAGEGSEQARCRDLANALGIGRQIRFLGHDPKPEELIALSDVCILTSEREGLPRSAVQYIAGGKPVILTRLTGIEELVVDGANGIITDPDDLGETAARTLGLLDDEALLARLASGARATDVSRWREEAMGERIETAYRAVDFTGNEASGSATSSICAIELFGLPGAGKTTLAKHLVEQLRGQGRTVRFSQDIMGDQLRPWPRSARRLALMAKALPLHPRTAVKCAGNLEIGRSSTRDKLKSLWNFYSVMAMSLSQRRDGGELSIMDQGLVQAVWSARVHGSPGDRTNIASILAAAGGLKQTLFVHVRAPIDTARLRLENRKANTSRMQRADRIDDDALWERGERTASDLAHCIKHELRSRSRLAHLITVISDLESDPEENAKAVLARLNDIEASRQEKR